MSTRATILAILPIYLNRDHSPKELYADFHERPGRGMGAHAMMDMGPRPPSVHEVLAGTAPPSDQPQPSAPKAPGAGHKHQGGGDRWLESSLRLRSLH